MKRLLLLNLFTLFTITSICHAQQESIFEIKNKISGAPSHEKDIVVEQWIVKRFFISEKLGVGSFDSILTFLPSRYQTDAGHYILDEMEGGLSEHAYNLILDSTYSLAIKTNNFWEQCDLLRYFNGKKLGSYKAEIDSAYRLAKKINNEEVMASNNLFHGNYYFYKTQFDSAIYFYRKSLDYYINASYQAQPCADLYNNIANAYLRKGKIDSVLFFYELALDSTKDNNYIGRKSIFINVANAYRITARYDSALYYLTEIEKELKDLKEPVVRNRLYRVYSRLFCDVNDLEKANKTAMDYLHYALFNKDTLQLIDAHATISLVKQLQHDASSAFYYSSIGIELLKYKTDAVYKSTILLQHGNNFLLLQKPDSALYYIQAAYKIDSATGASLYIAKDIYLRGNVFMQKHDTADAFKNFLYASSLLQPVTDISLARDIYHALSITAFGLHNVNDAWQYQNKFIQLDDSINRFQNTYALNELDTRYKLNDEKAQVKMLILITERNRLWMITGAILFLFVVRFFIFLRKNYKNKMQFSIQELQQKALRSQLNPHFIFNVMQSIKNKYAVNAEKGEELLVSFSSLIREVLNKSFLFEGTLEEEIDIISKYVNLQLQHTTLPIKFSIKISEDIKPPEIAFPSLALQPIIENAIKYGTINNNVVLKIQQKNAFLIIIVENDLPPDFSVSYKHSNGAGLQLTEERINLFNKKHKTKGGVQFEKNKNKFVTTISLAYIIKEQTEPT